MKTHLIEASGIIDDYHYARTFCGMHSDNWSESFSDNIDKCLTDTIQKCTCENCKRSYDKAIAGQLNDDMDWDCRNIMNNIF